MFVGHYGVSFASRKADASIPLWVLFIAAQLLDVAWAPLVLLGTEVVFAAVIRLLEQRSRITAAAA